MVQCFSFFALSVIFMVMMVYAAPVDCRFKDNDEPNAQSKIPKLPLPRCVYDNSCVTLQDSPSSNTQVLPTNCMSSPTRGDIVTSNDGGTRGNGAGGVTTKQTTHQGDTAQSGAFDAI